MKKVLKVILAIATVLLGLPLLLIVAVILNILGLFAVVILSASLTEHAPSPQESIGNYRCTVNCAYYVFQDGTEYAEYQYSQVSFDDNPYFKPITRNNRDEVLMFVEDYEGWVDAMKDNSQPEAQELYQYYRYDPASLSEGDYFYLQTKYPEYPFHNYDLYIFNAEEMTLYYFENVL